VYAQGVSRDQRGWDTAWTTCGAAVRRGEDTLSPKHYDGFFT